MSAFDHCKDVNDVALKPRLLRMLLRDLVPNDNRSLSHPSDLSYIVHTVRAHCLLSESVPDSACQKLVDRWTSAVDSWVNQVLSLVSSDVPDSCWAGVCLLGVTFGECSSTRFLASYSSWFDALLPHIQSSSSIQFVKVASLASASDLLTRLSAKTDGVACAGRVVQPIVKLLNEDRAAAEWEGAVHLLHTILDFFPWAVSRHYDSVESAVVSRMVSGNCSPNLLEKLACCLALLPKSHGDEESWSRMMQKILLKINGNLDDILEGLEEETKGRKVAEMLVPRGTHFPTPLGGYIVVREASSKVVMRSKQSLTPITSTLMVCCCTMLSSPYPVQVTIPVRPMLAVLERVLMVDGSLPEFLKPFTTSFQQEFVCSQLHALHLYSLELLTYIVNGIRSQLLPYAADIVQLLTHYSKKCAVPELRTKIYTITRNLLVTLGAGIALYLAQYIVNMASIDLSSSACSVVATSTIGTSSSSNGPIMQNCQRKRKRRRGGATNDPEAKQDVFTMDLETTKECSMLISLKIAALEALEALLSVGGALKADDWRSNIDNLLITFANNCRKGWANERGIFTPKEFKKTWADLQLSALRALLASLVAPACFRPPHLSQGLQIFREGKLIGGTKIAEFCVHAISSLELLIHPRALPLFEFRPPNKNSFGGTTDKVQGSTDILSFGHKLPLEGGDLGVSGIGLQDRQKYYMDALHIENAGNDSEVPLDNSHATAKRNKRDRKEKTETPSTVQDVEKTVDVNDRPADEPHDKKVNVRETRENSNAMMVDSKLGGNGSAHQAGQSSSNDEPIVQKTNITGTEKNSCGLGCYGSAQQVGFQSNSSGVVTGSPLVRSITKRNQTTVLLEATSSDTISRDAKTSTDRDDPSGLSNVCSLEKKETVVTRADNHTLKQSQINMDEDDTSSDSFPFPRVIADDDDSSDDGDSLSNSGGVKD